MAKKLTQEFENYMKEQFIHNGDTFYSDYLANCRIIACLLDNPQKKIFLLQKTDGRKILCKYACGEYLPMLKAENESFRMGKFPFVPYIIDYWETEKDAFLLREYIEGRTLQEIVSEEGILSLKNAVLILQKLCRALSYFHGMTPPIIYRDIKPSNILLTEKGDCYFIDMGTVRQYQEGATTDTVCMGTIDFAAPEQFGARQTDSRTDIYGLGVLFHYLLTGEMKISEASLAKLPRKASLLIKKCTAFNPDDRYHNIRQLEKSLSGMARDKKLTRWKISTAVASFLSFILLILLLAPVVASRPRKVVFSSPLLEQAVRQELGKAENEPVYYEDLKRITQLYICGTTVFDNENMHNHYTEPHLVNGEKTGTGDIFDISLLAEMSNLHYLMLDYQQIYDISPLKELPLLSLSLTGNPVSDLSPLSGNTTLSSLDIASTSVSSLEALSDCKALTILDCSMSPVGEMAPLTSLNLTELAMKDIPATDYYSLENIPLVRLRCRNIPLTVLPDLERISTLQDLTLYNCGITSLHDLDIFSGLIRLDVHSNNLTSLEGIENFSKLTNLVVSDNPVTDFSALKNAPSLFNSLQISESQLSYLYETIPEPSFHVNAGP